MAKMNLLKNGFEGRIANVYGVSVNKKYYLKAVPFSHTPHNQKQNDAFKAFGCLQRLSAQIAKTFWQFLPLTNKNQQRINAVAHWLKPCVSENNFDVNKMENVIPITNKINITNFAFFAEEQKIIVNYENYFVAPLNSNPRIFLGAFNSQFKGLGAIHFYGSSGTVSIPVKCEENEFCYLIMFMTYKKANKRKATALCIKEINE